MRAGRPFEPPVRKQHVLGRHMDGGGWLARMFLHQAGFVPDFGTFHHLDAVGAFFHDAAGANGYVGIALKARGLFRCFGVIKKIEAPSLVRAVGGAVPGTPAPGVHHGVQAFRSMHGGIDGAYGFTWGPAALLAGHGDGGERPFLREVSVDTYPVQGAALAIWSRPTTGMLFSARHAIMQALQPMQRDVSMAIFHW